MVGKHLLQLLCCVAMVVSSRGDFGAKDVILAAGRKALNKWLTNNGIECGWEDGTFMMGEHPHLALNQ
jgi:hypothetical protein